MRYIVAALLLFSSSQFIQAQETRLLRQPDISGQKIVFAYAGDLWTVNKQGGTAQRLTSFPGVESNPKFSPDGKMVAFSGQYGDNMDVYVVATEGGIPKRLTWHPDFDMVSGWSPDGKVVFTSGRDGAHGGFTKMYKIGLDGGMPEALPMPRAFRGTYSPDGKSFAYEMNIRWDEEWRNYRGGQNNPIWVLDLKQYTLRKLPMVNSHDMLPAWMDNNIYFLSDRDSAMNLYSYNTQTNGLEQLTFFAEYDIKNLSANSGDLVFEYGGDLYTMDVSSKQYKKVPIEVKGDFPWLDPKWVSAADYLAKASLSPTGQRAVFEARGEIITIPVKKGDARNLTNSSGSREHDPSWSPDGKSIAWFSDASGEYSLMIADQDGLSKPREIKIPHPTFYYSPEWSPDSKWIAFTDHIQQLWLTEVATGKTILVDKEPYLHPERTINPVWSPDSKWIGYSKRLPSQYHVIMAYSVAQAKAIQLTDGMSDAVSPGWDAKGKYLYFLASTNFALSSGWLDMSSYERPVRRSAYIMVLKKGEPSPLLPESDEEKITAEKKDTKKDDKKSDTDSSKVTVQIDLPGISQRILSLGLPERNYGELKAGAEGEIFISENVQNQEGATLQKYTIKERKAEKFLSPVNYFSLSADGKKLLYKSAAIWGIVETSGKPNIGDGSFSTSGITLKVDPRKEWRQIFREGWRYQRDYLYVRNTHGADWNKVYERYAPLLEHVAHRSDLNYLLDILGGEVSIGHSFVGGGDFPKIDPVKIGLLGADLEIANNRYRIKKIYTGENWNPDLRAPLSAPGVDVNEGDYIISVDGDTLKAAMNPYSLFENKANKQVTLKVSKNADGSNARTAIVVPVESERTLRNFYWVEHNRRLVDSLSHGQVAYVWLPNTGDGGYNNFNRYYFAQQDKPGVIIDERFNGGGSVADYFVDILSRKLQGYFNNVSGDKTPWKEPMTGILGPKVMIVNEMAGSGGDMLPYLFRQMKIGPIVGTKTWGGLVGIWDTPELMDGGGMTAPRGGFFNLDGKWDVENIGVTPDITVEMIPKEEIAGHDPQLEKAVETALKLLKENPVKLQPEPAAPIRSFRPKRN
ncbi:S41 family peptidase [Flavihumibacter profundi]|uniref:S41 family peptidase n=1 Tax=Flavihumibacter profundi TaxID=2716883 RepID=UPI001CC61B6A|nr:S41 family peptidase [Flavihumibacter profundi]MBZ5858393.1 PDZ domain-containing protein [Flavihumibacter profundi]